MSETTQSKILRLISSDDGIYRIDANYKCKTKDGLISTIEQNYFVKTSDETQDDFGIRVTGFLTEGLIHYSDEVEKDGFLYCESEMLSVKKSEIIRVWVDVGDIYSNALPE